ncbi:hypothetical protein ACFQZR_01310 [Paenibacillus sp. GCM10027629]|uniref:hypothetical protein n=1 Tax=Paenibacillus sp. GCM10027629 TaxID=3273414 RepID=UPI00363759B0
MSKKTKRTVGKNGKDPFGRTLTGYKHKRCSYPDQSKCACEKTYSDPDATGRFNP